MAKDSTMLGPHTNQPIPRPKSDAKVHEMEKLRRKNFPNPHGDVSPYFNPRSIREKTFEEFMYEIYLLIPPKKKQTSTKSKPKPNPYGEDPEVIAKRIKQKTQTESILHADRAAATHEANLKRKEERRRSRQNQLRPGEVRTFNKTTGKWESNLPPAPESKQQKPLRPGEVRTFNKTTGKWESNLT